MKSIPLNKLKWRWLLTKKKQHKQNIYFLWDDAKEPWYKTSNSSSSHKFFFCISFSLTHSLDYFKAIIKNVFFARFLFLIFFNFIYKSTAHLSQSWLICVRDTRWDSRMEIIKRLVGRWIETLSTFHLCNSIFGQLWNFG